MNFIIILNNIKNNPQWSFSEVMLWRYNRKRRAKRITRVFRCIKIIWWNENKRAKKNKYSSSIINVPGNIFSIKFRYPNI
jgi:hypothetical protein